MEHYQKREGLPRERRMYGTMHQHFQWLHIAKDVYTTVRQFQSGVQGPQDNTLTEIAVVPTSQSIEAPGYAHSETTTGF